MVMAAGLGTRLKPFTDQTPKPLLPVLGVPMIAWVASHLRGFGATSVIANIHHHADQMRAYFADPMVNGIEYRVSDESGRLLGSAGGIRNAFDQIRGDRFFWMNADVITNVDLAALERAHTRLRLERGVTMTLAVLPKAPGQGTYRAIETDESQGALRMVREIGALGVGRPLFCGVAILEKEALAHLRPGVESDFLTEVLLPAVSAGRVGAWMTPALWYDVGSPELWHHTHMDLIRKTESGSIPPHWRRLIESQSVRKSSHLWVDRRLRWSQISGEGPAYLSADSTARVVAPGQFIYGRRVTEQPGISYGEFWREVAPSSHPA